MLWDRQFEITDCVIIFEKTNYTLHVWDRIYLFQISIYYISRFLSIPLYVISILSMLILYLYAKYLIIFLRIVVQTGN